MKNKEQSFQVDNEGIGATNEYVARLTAPSTSDKNWIRYDKGGYNYCIHIKNSSVLPNCVGYAWGRWRELLNKYHNLSRGNAENWWANTADGYSRGQTPKLGAVICWRKGKAGYAADGAGHVAIVESVKADGSIVCSESSYGGARFNVRTVKPPYNLGSSLTFQGFIYLPISFDAPIAEKKPIEDIAREVIAGKWKNGETRKKLLEEAGYSYFEVQQEVNRLLHNKQDNNEIILKKGDKVKVLKAVTYENKKFVKWHTSYDVIEVRGDRIVIGKGKTVTAAVHRDNLQKLN